MFLEEDCCVSFSPVFVYFQRDQDGRAIGSKRQIDKPGELYEVTPHNAGLDQDLVNH